MKQDRAVLRAALIEYGLADLEAVDTIDKLVEYAVLLSEYGEANVIGTKSYEEIISEHVADSLMCGAILRETSSGRVVDLGSGAGLPGIPLAIVFPAMRFVLVDSVGKKVAFQKVALEKLRLRNVEVRQQRIEELGRTEERGNFDVVVSRALSSLNVLAEYALPLLKTGGAMVSMKGLIGPEELEAGARASKILGGGEPMEEQMRRVSGQIAKHRTLVIVEKRVPTPSTYPRTTGTPRKHPLGEIPK